MCTAFPFSLSLEGWADLPGDSAEPTWKSSNVLPSMLPLTCSNAQLNAAPPPSLGTTLRASSCRRSSILPMASSVPSGRRCKKQQGRQMSFKSSGWPAQQPPRFSIPMKNHTHRHGLQACPLALQRLRSLHWLARGDSQECTFLLEISKQPSSCSLWSFFFFPHKILMTISHCKI